MFQGTMIDELINTVERVEEKTRKQQEQNAVSALNMWEQPARRLEWQKIN